MLALILAATIQAQAIAGTCQGEDGKVVYCGDPRAVTGPLIDPDATAPLPPTAPVTVGLANHALAEAGAIAMTGAWDIYWTGQALQRCLSCFEANPLAPSVETRVALKTAGTLGAVGLVWVFEVKGHHNWAKGLAWGASIVQFAAGVNNMAHAVRRR